MIVVTGETDKWILRGGRAARRHGFLARPANYDPLLALIKLALGITPEEVEIVTLRVPVRVLKQLAEINSNLERARHRIVR